VAACATAALALALAGARGSGATPGLAERPVRYEFRTMGTTARLTLVTADSVAGVPLASLVRATFVRVDSLMSNWTQTSEVARINRELDSGVSDIEPETAHVLDSSLAVWRGSEGAFDITVEPLVRLWGFLGGPKRVPPDSAIASAFARVGAQRLVWDAAHRRLQSSAPGVRIDLGGIAKGYAAAAAGESLRARGIEDAIVDVSGNMELLGHAPGAAGWRVGIRDPRDRTPYFARLVLSGQGIATSAKYEQFVAQDGKTYGHIMDPRTGRPAEGLISVTVVAPDAFAADAWDTPLFVLGAREARRLAKERDDIAVVLVAPGRAPAGGATPPGRADSDTVYVENALKDRFALEPGQAERFVVVYF
jgi:thiamine biosynthesis lipoprotein